MSMIIAHNMSALNTKRQFGSSSRGMSSSMEKLSSGYKINTGKDDPSGLLISEKLRSQLQGYLRAKQNTEEAMNVMGIAEGAMNEMNDILKKMKSLATHAANNGVTSKDQIAADQAELDSGIQTIDRIAQTTQYARDNILNGAKEIAFDSTTGIKGTQQNSLVNVRDSSFDQIFKRDGYSVSISYSGGTGNIPAGTNGYPNATTAHPGSSLTGDAAGVNFAMQASKAYLEIDTATPDTTLPGGGFPAAQIKDGLFTQEQVFTLTGNTGSRQFTFPKGASVTALVKDIHSAVGATGIDASLIFNSNQTLDIMTDKTKNADSLADGSAARAPGDAAVFGSYRDPDTGNVTAGVTSVDDLQGIQWGRNTDGQGKIYIKYITDTEVELFKDSSMSPESKVATGRIDPATNPGLCTFAAFNNSGLDGRMFVANNATNAQPNVNLPDVRGNYICTGGIEGNNRGHDLSPSIAWSGAATTDPAVAATPGGMAFDAGLTTVTGIDLGKNTNEEGRIFYKTVCDANGMVTMYAYRDEKMDASDLVAQSAPYVITAAGPMTIVLDEVRDNNDTYGTGLGIIFSANVNPFWDLAANGGAGGPTEGSVVGNMTFDNLGARVYSTEYGSDSYLKITQDKGSIFSSYDTPGSDERTMIDAGELGTTKLIYGQDATIAVNGTQVKTNGLTLNMATQDIQARFTFNGGKVGSTTLAQVGYDVGSPFTKIGALNLGLNAANDDGLSAYLCNAGHSTNETLGDFQGGMQLQLGEGAGDQNRTVVSLRSMTTENLGRITRGGYWDSANPSVWSEKQFTLKDCFGGGAASLSADPTLTMAVIDQAIDDISQQRALLGAMQANLLQTNANNLDITYENVTKTESGIRDADMATEMSEFTKYQVLQSAGISMMSQANQRSQQVLQLLQ